MKVVVDMDRCESHGQCVLAAPNVFLGFDENGALEYEAEPPASGREAVARAVAVCPAAAIRIEGGS